MPLDTAGRATQKEASDLSKPTRNFMSLREKGILHITPAPPGWKPPFELPEDVNQSIRESAAKVKAEMKAEALIKKKTKAPSATAQPKRERDSD